MMGQHSGQEELFNYQVNLDRRVRTDHPLRAIRSAIDFSFVRQEVADCYGRNVRGRKLDELPSGVVARLHQFIADIEWIEQAPRSWLEGFDIIGAVRSNQFLPDLSAIAEASGSSRGSQFAAFLAADRLTMASPVEALGALNSDPSLFAGQPNVRAGLFARADVREENQRQLLENYFARHDVSPAERASFADLFPLYDLAVSQNLLTRPASRAMSDMIAQDKVTVAQIDRWLAQAEFEGWHSVLKEVRSKLESQLAHVGG
jgi:hypothetical protein